MKQTSLSKFTNSFLSILMLAGTASALAAPGDLDLTFGGNGKSRIGFGGGYDVGHAVAVQSDGKLVIAGLSTINYPNGVPQFALVRFDTNNVLDTSFGNGGKVLTPVNVPVTSNAGAQINSIKIQADGKIVAAGFAYHANYSDFTVARYNPDGSLDTSFGPDGTGIVYTDFGEGAQISAMIVQADGRIVVAGHTIYNANAGEGAVAMARYQTNGMLDVSFGTGGMQMTTGVTGYTGAHALTIQADRKILAVGIGIGPGHNGIDFALYRYTTNGVLDSTFGGGTGEVFTKISTSNNNYFDSANAVAMQFGTEVFGSVDKIVIAGSYRSETSNHSLLALARYNLDGSLDSSFGNSGIITNAITGGTGLFDGDTGNSVLVQGTLFQARKIIIGGSSQVNGLNYYTLVRYTATGAFDTTFGNGSGKVTLSLGAVEAQAYALTAQGSKYVLAGYTGVYSHNFDFTAARFNSDGSLDTAFGNSGVLNADIADLASQARAVAIQADGKIVVAGNANDSTNNVCAVARYNPDGSLDAGFDADGKLLTAVGSNESDAYAVRIQPDQKILAAGMGNGGFAVVRYNPNGSLDSSFGGSGMLTTTIGSSATARALTLQKDGKIIVAGYSYNGVNDDFAVVRYTTNGFLDTTFGTLGKTTTAISTGQDQANAVGIQSDGKIVLAGYGLVGSSSDFALTRYSTNGVLDASFGSFGRVITDFGAGNIGEGLAMVIQPDNKIVVTGVAVISGTAYVALTRYNANGTPDSTFGIGGKVTTQVGLVVDYGNSLALQPDGKIVVAGLSQIGAHYQFAILRYNANGFLDDSYGTGGKVVIDFNSGTDESGYAIAMDSVGRAVIAGDAGGEFGVAKLLGNPYLNIMLTVMQTVSVSWPFPSTGWSLQQNTDLTTAGWSAPAETINNDGTNNFIIVNPPAGKRFYRLASP